MYTISLFLSSLSPIAESLQKDESLHKAKLKKKPIRDTASGLDDRTIFKGNFLGEFAKLFAFLLQSLLDFFAAGDYFLIVFVLFLLELFQDVEGFLGPYFDLGHESLA